MAQTTVAVYTDVMHRSQVLRAAAIALLVPSAIALTGCSSKSATTPGGSSNGSCAAGYVSGKIAGQPKCLQNGQQCQDANASDYKKYGFTCTKNNGRYELKKS